MKFTSALTEAYKVVLEQDAPPATGQPPQDAAVPQPETQSALPEPKPGATEQTTIPPEGYVEMVRLLAKALTINLPIGEIDDVFTDDPITQENALPIKDALLKIINDNTNFQDNPERLANPHYEQFFQTITEKNYQSKFKHLLDVMKKYVKLT